MRSLTSLTVHVQDAPPCRASSLLRVGVGELGLDLELVVDRLAREGRVELRQDLPGPELERDALPRRRP